MDRPSRQKLRRDFESFLYWYFPASVIAGAISAFAIPYVMRKSFLTHDFNEVFMSVLSVIAKLPGVVAAVWMWKQPHRDQRLRVIWTIFSLVQSMWAIGLYLLIEALAPAAEEEEEEEEESEH